MQNLLAMEEQQSTFSFNKAATHPAIDSCWFDDTTISDIDYFIKTLSSIKEKEAKPDLIGSIITHYASNWLPELGDGEQVTLINSQGSPQSVTASWMKKRFLVESIIGILPPEKDSVSCNFLLRLLRAANMVCVEPAYREELERRVSWQLDQASLKELMIPSFSHNCNTLLDVELVLRLVTRFVSSEDVSRTGAGLVKVAKLVDSYLAEAAVDSHLTMDDFVTIACALPSHARCLDDGLYRAIDTYIKAHQGLSKEDRMRLCNLIDSRKLSAEACLHAAQNERLPVRAVIQVLLSEQNKLYNHIDQTGSMSGPRLITGFDCPGRCNSKRGMNIQQMEIQRLKEDVLRLQSQCMNMEVQMDRLMQKKKGVFGWKKLGIIRGFKTNRIGESERESEAGAWLKTPMKQRTGRGKTSSKWRNSMS